MAPANRVDLLVQAPMTPGDLEVRIQPVMARNQVLPTPDQPTKDDPVPGTALMTVDVSGDPVVTQNGKPMPFPPEGKAPDQPKFLADITDAELARSNYSAKTFTFDSKFATAPMQHTINGYQFKDTLGHANVDVTLGNVEEWTIKNTTSTASFLARLIDHPFHIHINPFQITEVFDPNEGLVDPATNALLGQLQKADQDGNPVGKVMTREECDKLPEGTHCKTFQVPRYVTDNSQKSNDPDIAKRQCFLDPTNENTWSVAGACGPQKPGANLIWWDTFAIPSALAVTVGTDTKVIPGYFKMRSRFVDYFGTYVMHCHILIHEDRGMMFTVQVTPAPMLMVHHH
jgi:FtsP/CotA-like multicopper oxidase with cupredoxin domain